MIIDDNNVSIDSAELSGGTITGNAIGLTSYRKPGRQTFLMTAFTSDKATGGSALSLKLQQSDAQDGTFEDVEGSAIDVPSDDLQPGIRVGWRILPMTVKKQWIKVVATASGYSDGTLFAAVVTEDEFPYEKGLYIDKNVTIY